MQEDHNNICQERPYISYIVPAKNTSKYILQLLQSIITVNGSSFEVVVVDDGSTDETGDLVISVVKSDPRIRYIRNPGFGKVAALNVGYKCSRGVYIKFIDSDDTLRPSFLNVLKALGKYDAYIHDYAVTSSTNKFIQRYKINKSYIYSDLKTVVGNCISLPRAVWTLRRGLCDMIFPIPESFPYEDVWFSFVIKKNVEHIEYLPVLAYNYRQHDAQTFGGVLNYGRAITIFRANRLLRFITALQYAPEARTIIEGADLETIKRYLKIIIKRPLSFLNILQSSLSIKKKLQALFVTRFNCFLPLMKRIQWAFEQYRH